MPDATPLFCHRCGKLLVPGAGDWYVVRIEAFADPTPPTIDEQDLREDLEAEMARLVDEMADRSERELADTVHRRMTLHLCGPCYAEWIEDPARPSRNQ